MTAPIELTEVWGIRRRALGVLAFAAGERATTVAAVLGVALQNLRTGGLVARSSPRPFGKRTRKRLTSAWIAWPPG